MATNSDDILNGTDGPDVLEGLEGNDVLYGLAGDDRLDGGPGADSMHGGLGDDTFLVDDLGDTVFENPGEGVDTVLSSAPYFILPDGVEILRLVGDAGTAGYGNDGPNQLFGNAGNNTLLGLDSSDFLSGGAGNDYLDSDGGSDTLDGGAGADNLNGGEGDDTYVFGAGYGADSARDTGGNDRVRLAGGVRVSDVSLARLGNDLEVAISGSADRLRLFDWFSGGTTRIESIAFEDGPAFDAAAITQALANRAPAAADDVAAVSAGGAAIATGSVLANDADPNGDRLAVANPGTYAGVFGTLVLGADGIYAYTLNDALPAVQALPGGATATDAFAYTVTDGVALATGTSTATLAVTVTGANDAPQLAAPLADRNATAGQAFAFALPVGAFADVDANDSLTFTAALANERPLPDWLEFDATTGRFTGTPPAAAAGTTLQIRVYANDLFGAAASDDFALEIAPDPRGTGREIVGTPCNDRLVGTPFDDRIDGRRGHDVMIGGRGDDTYFVDATQGRGNHGHHGHGHGHHHRRGRVDQVVEHPNEGHDTVYSKASYALPANVEDLHLLGGGDLDGTGNAQANRIEGNGGRNTLRGGAGDDLLQGGSGKDTLYGDCGTDVLQGGRGDDRLVDHAGGAVFDGGSGNDAMTGGRGADFFAGGRGDDVLRLGGGDDVIAWRKGDGADRIEGERQDGVLVIGGIRHQDLLFRKSGADLVLEMGGRDRLVLDDWYRGKQPVATLEVIGAPSDEGAVETYDFRALAAAFDAARAAHTVRGWNLMNELLDAHLASAEDAALGGDLARQYALNGTLAGMGWSAARETVAAPGFGRAMQALHSAADFGADPVRLGA